MMLLKGFMRFRTTFKGGGNNKRKKKTLGLKGNRHNPSYEKYIFTKLPGVNYAKLHK
jgi:hypothetical protein